VAQAKAGLSASIKPGCQKSQNREHLKSAHNKQMYRPSAIVAENAEHEGKRYTPVARADARLPQRPRRGGHLAWEDPQRLRTRDPLRQQCQL